jgi:hypothetical protein
MTKHRPVNGQIYFTQKGKYQEYDFSGAKEQGQLTVRKYSLFKLVGGRRYSE